MKEEMHDPTQLVFPVASVKEEMDDPTQVVFPVASVKEEMHNPTQVLFPGASVKEEVHDPTRAVFPGSSVNYPTPIIKQEVVDVKQDVVGAFVPHQPGVYTYTTQIDDKQTGFLVGIAGAALSDIKQISGANIELYPLTFSLGTNTERTLRVDATTLSQVIDARNLLLHTCGGKSGEGVWHKSYKYVAKRVPKEKANQIHCQKIPNLKIYDLSPGYSVVEISGTVDQIGDGVGLLNHILAS